MLRSDWLSYHWAICTCYSLLVAKSAGFLTAKKDLSLALRYLHRQIFNILFCSQNLSTVSSDDVICISGVLF